MHVSGPGSGLRNERAGYWGRGTSRLALGLGFDGCTRGCLIGRGAGSRRLHCKASDSVQLWARRAGIDCSPGWQLAGGLREN